MEKNRKLNNKGVTLVELLIGVSILAIIIGPFVGAFMMSTRTNMHSRQMAMATTAGQNVMEEVRGKLLTSDKASEADDAPYSGLIGIIEKKSGDAVESLLESDEGKNALVSAYEYKWDKDNNKFFGKKKWDDDSETKIDVIKYIREQSVNGNDYIAEVILDPKFDTADAPDSEKNNPDDADDTDYHNKNEYTDYNAESFASVNSMDSKTDCSFFLSPSMDNAAVEMLSGKNVTARKLIITIGGDEPEKNNVKKNDVSVQVDYTCEGETKARSLFPDARHISGKINGDSALKNIFIFYTPYTPDDMIVGIDESIEIRNEIHKDGERVDGVTVYLICQASDKKTSLVNYGTYKPVIYLKEHTLADTDKKSVSTKLRIGGFLYLDANKNPDTATEMKFDNDFTYKFKYEKDDNAIDATVAEIGATDLMAKKTSDVAYDVTIRVYAKEDYFADESEEAEGAEDVDFFGDFMGANNNEKHISKVVYEIKGSKERQ